MAAVFIAQSTLQDWSDAGKVRLQDNVLLLVKEQREVSLTPAVRFTEVLGGAADPNGLVGKVKTRAQLDALEAEHYMDSVLLGEVAYQVVEGFLGDLMGGQPPRAAPAGAPPSSARSTEQEPAAPAPDAGDTEDEAAALSRLFLDTVR